MCLCVCVCRSVNSYGGGQQLNDDEMRKTANELLDSMQDSRFSESEFFDFVHNLSANQAAAAAAAAATAAAVVAAAAGDDSQLVDKWVHEFTSFSDDTTTAAAAAAAAAANANKQQSLGDGSDDYWSELQNEWDLIASAASGDHPWLDDLHKLYEDTYAAYEFDTENAMSEHASPLDEGLRRLEQHDIVNAVLLFERAVQLEPRNARAWQLLATTQMKNEQDAQAIRAARRCLELDEANLMALSTLATSYTNESMQRMAFDALLKWMRVHPVYSTLLATDAQASQLLARLLVNNNNNNSNSNETTRALGVVSVSDFIDLQEIYLRAVRGGQTTTTTTATSVDKTTQSTKPITIDADLQCCLGVLFHLSGEYAKAADCFKTALQVQPDDYLLWNKLGATYANNNRNEEAIDAYYRALKLCPGFVRARYNLGIGCMNLGANKEAIEHFLTALVQQNQATLSTSSKQANADKPQQQTTVNTSMQMSDTIWSTLRLALSYMNRSDLYEACASRNLAALTAEFKI